MSLEVICKINGLETYLSQYIKTLEISGSYTGIYREAKMDLAYGVYTENIPAIEIPLYSPIWIRDLNDDGSFKEGLFSGIVVDRDKTDNTLSLTCFDYAYYLKRNKTSKGLDCSNAEQATKELCNKYGINTTYLYPTNIQISMLIAPQSIYDTIMGMYTEASKQTGEKYYLVADYYNNISVNKVGINMCPKIINPCTGDLNIGDGNLISIKETQNGENLVNSVEVYDQNNNLIDTLTNYKNYPTDRFGILNDTYTQEDGVDYKTAVNNTVFHGIDKSYELEMLGDYTYWTNESVKIFVPWIDDLKKQSDGSYRTAYITSDTHTWDMTTDSYKTKLNITMYPVMDEKELKDATKQEDSNSESGGVISKALKWALDTANDNSVGYSLGAWGPNLYDCSHFVITAYRKAGLSLSGASYTGDMYNAFVNEGFKDVTSSVDLDSGNGLKAGDVLLNTATHTEMYSGNGNMVGARTANAAFADQVEEHSYNNHPWNYVLRYSGSDAYKTKSGSSSGWSNKFCKWVESWEGFVDHWYDDGGGTKTIGIGTAVTSDLGKQLWNNGVSRCTEKEAEQWMLQEMKSWWGILAGKGAGDLKENEQYFLCDYAYQHGYTNMNRFVSMLLNGNVSGVCNALGNDRRSNARRKLLQNGEYVMND